MKKRTFARLSFALCIALSAAVFAASVGFYRLEKKPRSVSRFLILSRRGDGDEADR